MASAIAVAEPEETVNVADANTTVITAADIARERPANVRELLRRSAGVDDTSGTLTLRGVPGVAVELNGLPSDIGAVTALKPEEIERIEILRGATSARFGANAMGGAVVVRTRNAATRWEATVGGDSAGSHAVRVAGGVAPGPFDLQLNAFDDHTRGFRRVPTAPYPSQITVEDERYRTHGVTVRGGWRTASRTAGLEWKSVGNHDHYGRPNWHADYSVDSVRLNAGTDIDGVALELVAGQERRDDSGLLDAGTGTGDAGLAPDRYVLSDSRVTDARTGASWRRGEDALELGLHYRDAQERFGIRDYATGATTFQLDARTRNHAVTAQARSKLAETVVSAGLRCDRYRYSDISVFDAAGTGAAAGAGTKRACNPKIDARRPLGEGVSVNASWGTGFIPPSADQLYYSDLGAGSQFLANPELRPQRSVTYDLGLSVKRDGREFAMAAFLTSWTDKIGVVIVDYGTPLRRQTQNIGRAESHGAELQAALPLGDAWKATANYTWVRTRIVADDAHPEWVGNELPDMPRHKANAALVHETGAFTTRLVARAMSAAWSDGANTAIDAGGYDWRKHAYAVYDAATTIRLGRGELTLALDNVFDRRYTTGFFRLGQERLARAELRYRF